MVDMSWVKCCSGKPQGRLAETSCQNHYHHKTLITLIKIQPGKKEHKTKTKNPTTTKT